MTATTTLLSEAELRRRLLEAFPESRGPGTDHESGAVTYGQPPSPRVGKIPHLMDPERMWAERDAEEARQAAIPPEVRAAQDLILTAMREGRRF